MANPIEEADASRSAAMPKRPSSKPDVHQRITDQIISAIEKNPGSWTMPWHTGADHSRPQSCRPQSCRPQNCLTGAYYRGINILSLWCSAQHRRYESHLWGTYRQWAERGAHRRR